MPSTSSLLGLSLGALVHVAAATAGLSAILVTSAMAFGVVKAPGAGYLIYLGLRTPLAGRPTAAVERSTPRTASRMFMDGILVSVLNPKIAIFFLAFLPQFVRPSLGPVPQQVMALGLIYVALALVTDGSYALLAGSLREWLGEGMTQGPRPRYASGVLYLGLGVSTALTSWR